MEGKAGMADENVRVFVRIRPPNGRENRSAARSSCMTQIDSTSVAVHAKQRVTFTYDHVAGPESTQEDIFQHVGKPITDTCIKGYNGTIFAYGQTGSGKTFTITGPQDEDRRDLRGLMPRVFEYLMSQVQRLEHASLGRTTYLIKASFMEIYNEKIFDLLEFEGQALALREDLKKGAYVEGLNEEVVASSNDCYELMEKGLQNRRVGETAMNRESSRSHSVYKLSVQSSTTSEDGITTDRTSQFNVIDLAGSERQKHTAAVGDRLKEASQINKSLSALGNVITGLVDVSRGRHRHIPYRDSKLTFLLKQALGGNSKTFIIACVSPAGEAFGETYSTLRFAKRAKCIKNKAVCNENTQATVDMLMRQCAELKKQLMETKAMNKIGRRRISMGLLSPTPLSGTAFDFGSPAPRGGHEATTSPPRPNIDYHALYKTSLKHEEEARGENLELKQRADKLLGLADARARERLAVKLRCELEKRRSQALLGSGDAKISDEFEARVSKLVEALEGAENVSGLEATIASQDFELYELKATVEFLNGLVTASDLDIADEDDLDAMGLAKAKAGLYQTRLAELKEDHYQLKVGSEVLSDRVETLQSERDRLSEEIKATKADAEQAAKDAKAAHDEAASKEAENKRVAEQLIALQDKQVQDIKAKHAAAMRAAGEAAAKRLSDVEERLVAEQKRADAHEEDAERQSRDLAKAREAHATAAEALAQKTLEMQQLQAQVELEAKRKADTAASHRREVEALKQSHATEVARVTASLRADLESKIQDISSKLTDVKDSDEASRAQIKTLQAKNALLTQESSALEAAVKQVTQQVEHARAQHKEAVAQMRKSSEAKQALLEKQHSETVAHVEAKCKGRIEAIVAQHAESLSRAEKQTAEARARANDTQKQLTQVKAAIEEAKRKAEEELAGVRARAESAESKVKATIEQLENAKTALNETKEQSQVLQQTVDDANQRVQNLEAKVAEVETKAAELYSSAQAEKKRADATSAALSEAKREAQGAAAARQKLEFELVDAREQNECLRETNDYQSTKITDLESIVEAKAAALKSKAEEVARAANAQNEAEERLQSAQQQIQTLCQEKTELKAVFSERDAAQSQLDQERRARGEADKKVEALSRDAQTARDELQNVRAELKDTKTVLARKNSEHRAAASRLRERELEVQALEQQVASTSEELKACDIVLREKEARLEALEKEFEQTTTDLSAQVKKLRAEAKCADGEHRAAIEALRTRHTGELEEREAAHQKEMSALAEGRLKESQAQANQAKKELRKEKHVVKLLKEKVTNLTVALKEENSERRVAQLRVDQLKKDRRAEASEIKMIRAELAKHDEIVSKAAARAEGLEESLAKARASREQLENDMAAYRKADEKRFQEKAALKSKCEALRETSARAEGEAKLVRKELKKLRDENTRLIGHQNINQKIQHHMKIKKENEALKKQLKKLELSLSKVNAGPAPAPAVRTLRSGRRIGLSERSSSRSRNKENIVKSSGDVGDKGTRRLKASVQSLVSQLVKLGQTAAETGMATQLRESIETASTTAQLDRALKVGVKLVKRVERHCVAERKSAAMR